MDIISLALKEDIGSGDITSGLITDRKATAKIICMEDCVLSGIDSAKQVFATYDHTTDFKMLKSDGSRISKGTVVGVVKGRLRSLLACERTALNFLQHLSGIATNARGFADLVKGTGVTLLDTRKTTPGLRELDKRAARLGGVVNHRFGLYDMMLVKDNHIKAEGLDNILGKLRGKRKVGVEVEVDTLHQLERILGSKAKVDMIMLDNFNLRDAKKAVGLIRRSKRNIKVEYSGNVNKLNIRRIASTGVGFISIGSELTLSAKAIDFRMEIG